MKKKERKTFIVGDVHGCFKEFLSLLKSIDYSSTKYRLILVGDVINRGPYSLEMLHWVKTHKIEMVRGNHEQNFINRIKNNKILSSTLKKLKEDMGNSLNSWIKWLNKIPFYIEEKDFLVVHAGLVPQKKPENSKPQFLMNIRTWGKKGKDIKSPIYPAWHDFYKEKKLVVYGHWAEQGLKIKKNSIGLDTGCVYGFQLSGVLLPERKIIQVPALKNYNSIHLSKKSHYQK
ncbi:MAG: metallophosphoesterase [Bdellovibrionales bacterium]|nr:metallophosphoesterase [Bdellovibrionales bacterium]